MPPTLLLFSAAARKYASLQKSDPGITEDTAAKLLAATREMTAQLKSFSAVGNNINSPYVANLTDHIIAKMKQRDMEERQRGGIMVIKVYVAIGLICAVILGLVFLWAMWMDRREEERRSMGLLADSEDVGEKERACGDSVVVEIGEGWKEEKVKGNVTIEGWVDVEKLDSAEVSLGT